MKWLDLLCCLITGLEMACIPAISLSTPYLNPLISRIVFGKLSLKQIIFFFKVHLIKVRSLSYCRIIDYDKHFELTHCFSSQNLLIFCYKWQVLVVPLQIEQLEENWENTWFTQDSLSNCGARPPSSWEAVLPFNVLDILPFNVPAKGLLLGFFWMETRSLPCRTQSYRFWVQNTTAHSLLLDTTLANFLSESCCPLLYINQEDLHGNINDRSTVLRERRHLKRLHTSFSVTSMSLCSGTSAFVPASGIFGDGKLNLLPPVLALLPPSGHISTHLKLCCRAVGLHPSPMPGLGWDAWCDQKLDT